MSGLFILGVCLAAPSGVHALVGDLKPLKEAAIIVFLLGLFGIPAFALPLVVISVIASSAHYFIRNRSALAHAVALCVSAPALPLYLWINDNEMINLRVISVTMPLLASFIASLSVRPFIDQVLAGSQADMEGF